MTDAEVIDGEATEVTDNLPAVRHHEAVVARDEITVDELIGQRDKIVQAMDRAMDNGVHYGVIPGTTKPTLLKPGAELLNVLLRLAPSYQRERIWHDDGHLTVESNCTLTHIPSGLVIAAGGGLCSTRESKYAYRQEGRVCPNCGQPAIIKGKADYGGGWLCFKKKDGCGAKWPDDSEQARAFENAEVGKVPNPDLADSYNTVVKMADKRALIAAVLNGTAASDVFTQDMEEVTAAVSLDHPQPNTQAEPETRPGTSLPAAFPAGKDLLERIGAALTHAEPSVDWRATWDSAIQALYGYSRANVSAGDRNEAIVRLANVAESLTRGGDFPPPTVEDIVLSFAEFFEGIRVDVVYHEPGEAIVTGDVEPDDSIPFEE